MERPEALLRELLRECPGLAKNVELLLEGKEDKDVTGWPDDVFLPVGGWIALAQHYTGASSVDLETMSLALRLNALGTWRYYKGIYRVPEAMMDALAKTELPDQIPLRVFRRLPEGCLYIEATRAMETSCGVVCGWFVTLDYDYRSGAWELRIIEDFGDKGLRLVPIELTETMLLKDAVATFATSEGVSAMTGILGKAEDLEAAREGLLASVEAALKVLLYICSDEPEITDEAGMPASPPRPNVRRVKGRIRAFEQPKARVWTVGETMARAIVAHEARSSTRTGTKMAPHMRRAHWHGYWTGPKDGPRNFIYHWIPPLPVNEDLTKQDGSETEEL